MRVWLVSFPTGTLLARCRKESSPIYSCLFTHRVSPVGTWAGLGAAIRIEEGSLKVESAFVVTAPLSQLHTLTLNDTGFGLFGQTPCSRRRPRVQSEEPQCHLRGVSECLRDVKEVHTTVCGPSASFLCGKKGGDGVGCTSESEVSSPSIRRIIAYVWVVMLGVLLV